MSDDNTDNDSLFQDEIEKAPESTEPTIEAKPKKKVGRPTREEAARKAASRPGRRPGSKNKTSKLKRDEAKDMLLRHISLGISTLATLCKTSQSDTVRYNCAKTLVEVGLELYEEDIPKENNKSGEQPTTPQAKVFPFAVK